MFFFDELFVKCLHMAGVCSENKPCVTTNLNTNFKNAVPSESYAVLTVGIARNEGKKYYLSGKLYNGDPNVSTTKLFSDFSAEFHVFSAMNKSVVLMNT